MDITLLQPKLPLAVFAELPASIQNFAIDDELMLAHFLSQCAYESENFTAVIENLNYSAQALLATFPRHFNADQASTYARHPEMIANRAYASRLGNGDEASGDGWKYRGRGYIQLTGKVNYQAFAHSINVPAIVDNPDLVATTYPLSSAGFFFKDRNLFAIAEEGPTDAIVKQITTIINGGLSGLAERTSLFHIYYNLLTAAPAA